MCDLGRLNGSSSILALTGEMPRSEVGHSFFGAIGRNGVSVFSEESQKAVPFTRITNTHILTIHDGHVQGHVRTSGVGGGAYPTLVR